MCYNSKQFNALKRNGLKRNNLKREQSQEGTIPKGYNSKRKQFQGEILQEETGYGRKQG